MSWQRAITDLIYHDKILTALGSRHDQQNRPACRRHLWRQRSGTGSLCRELPAPAGKRSKPTDHRKRRPTLQHRRRLGLAYQLQIPAVYDNLHHAINPPPSGGNDQYWIAEAKKTWKAADGKQKIHYSQQAPGKRPGAHTDTIQLVTFLQFYNNWMTTTIDIMLEVKDKNLSAIKCQNATTEYTSA